MARRSRGHCQAERLRRLHVQRHLELDWQSNGKLCWLGATENAIEVGRGTANDMADVWSIRQEAAVLEIYGVPTNCQHLVPRRQRNDRGASIERKESLPGSRPARPPAPRQRDAFLHAVASDLASHRAALRRARSAGFDRPVAVVALGASHHQCLELTLCHSAVLN
jgi:hypothetical protein